MFAAYSRQGRSDKHRLRSDGKPAESSGYRSRAAVRVDDRRAAFVLRGVVQAADTACVSACQLCHSLPAQSDPIGSLVRSLAPEPLDGEIRWDSEDLVRGLVARCARAACVLEVVAALASRLLIPMCASPGTCCHGEKGICTDGAEPHLVQSA